MNRATGSFRLMRKNSIKNNLGADARWCISPLNYGNIICRAHWNRFTLLANSLQSHIGRAYRRGGLLTRPLCLVIRWKISGGILSHPYDERVQSTTVYRSAYHLSEAYGHCCRSPADGWDDSASEGSPTGWKNCHGKSVAVLISKIRPSPEPEFWWSGHRPRRVRSTG